MISTLKTVMVTVGLAAWFCAPNSPASATEANCGSNRDAICVSGMVPKSDPARVWSLLEGNLKYALYYFDCLGGDQLSCTVVGGELIADRDLPFDADASAALLGPSCDLGHEFACVAVGAYFMETAAYDVDPMLVLQLAQRACRADAESCVFEASLYLDEGLSPVDHAKATEIYSYACARKAGESCYLLALLHLESLAPNSSEATAFDLIAKSCELGVSEGCFDLGAQYPNQPSNPKEIKARKVAFQRSCTLGYAAGCYVAGLIVGDEAPFWKQDFEEELSWQERGCSLGDPDSCARIGNLHDEELIANPDPANAIKFTERGCELGGVIACANLGLKYEYGMGTDINGEKAFKAYKFACDEGNGGGCNGLGNIYAKGMAGEQDDFLAVEYFEKSCELGDPIGCTNVAYFAENQRGVFRLNSKIQHFYQLGCNGGFQEACKRLKDNDAE